MVNIASYFRKRDGKEEPLGPLLSPGRVYFGCPSEINPESCESVVNGNSYDLFTAFTWSETQHNDSYWNYRRVGNTPLSENDILYVRHVWALALE